MVEYPAPPEHRHLLIVEGQTDKIFFRKAITKWNLQISVDTTKAGKGSPAGKDVYKNKLFEIATLVAKGSLDGIALVADSDEAAGPRRSQLHQLLVPSSSTPLPLTNPGGLVSAKRTKALEKWGHTGATFAHPQIVLGWNTVPIDRAGELEGLLMESLPEDAKVCAMEALACAGPYQAFHDKKRSKRELTIAQMLRIKDAGAGDDSVFGDHSEIDFESSCFSTIRSFLEEFANARMT